MTDRDTRLSRRTLLRGLGVAGLGTLAGCTSGSIPSIDDEETVAPRTTVSGDPDVQATLTAAPGTVSPAGSSARNWLYDESFPGSELRATEGDIVRVDLRNRLPEETTIHWHGLPVPNSMDGVPDVTQQPVEPDEAFTYKFRAEPAGTYFFHSHVGLQLDRGLSTPLVIEEKSPHVEYDREYTVVFDDYLTQPPEPLEESSNGGGSSGGMGGGGMGMGGMGGGGRGGMMGDLRPPYAGLLVNGRLPADPATFDVKQGERVRLRFVNASSATAFRVGVAGHELRVSHADGRPVEPVPVDSFVFGAGERYDAVVEATNPGAWEVRGQAVDGDERPARAVLRYGGASRNPTRLSSWGRTLQYGDLRAKRVPEKLRGSPDRTLDLTLSPEMGGSYGWLIDGQAYPDADPLQIQEGEHVRVKMTNRSPVLHPMHLHGHFFRVGDAMKDTVIVPGHMGSVTFDFLADNPGEWLFHCHNLYHLEAGMARVVKYV
ncbi:Multicopper oxidase with three cupredoxin domains (includes cell division protein FtsP and spore coat protein CotA) [Haladaptatus litoreus]|uniref:Multicopper oxidase with three cupredoxin domains (Includes cell division protein FtsP and spore coat protein CotA) n=1 Tax=Haladaptatus litoreus TaxID=553468 RepID=A0A1N7FCU0_9EURY|nr:multicopper oxidase family protein [Haladaptatus litoreus]SIR98110.1 Multicopper oxidase with three cupredoxin domains (includes cell division protein FtsP and spore coat protein CotA) [Haladaptatus litoreus]